MTTREAIAVTQCPGCGLPAPNSEVTDAPGGPASAHCFALFGELLARSFADADRRRVHQLLVDAYTTQHPGGRTARQIQAVAICLMTLHLSLDDGGDPQEGPALHKRMVGSGIEFHWLQPPRLDSTPTVARILRAATADAYEQQVRAWAAAVWNAWEPHRDTIRAWTASLSPSR